MTIQETEKLLTYLVIAYPNSKPYEDKKTKDAFMSVWTEPLKTFPYVIGQEAVKSVVATSKYFPTLGELINACDSAWQDFEQMRRNEAAQAERDAAKMLFSEPLDKVKKKGGNIAALSVALVRDVCNGEIKYQSPEWNKRQAEIEELAGVVSYVYD